MRIESAGGALDVSASFRLLTFLRYSRAPYLDIGVVIRGIDVRGGQYYFLDWDRFLDKAWVVLLNIVVLQRLVESRPCAWSRRADKEKYPHQLVRVGFTHDEHLFSEHLRQDAPEKRSLISEPEKRCTGFSYPMLHISTCGPYIVSPINSSGARYHRVTTMLV